MANIIIMGIFFIVAVATVLLLSKFENRRMLVILVGAVLSVALAWVLFREEFGYMEFPHGFDFHQITSNYVSWYVLLIVFGMSLLVAILEITGVFDWVALKVIKFSIQLSKGEVSNIPTSLLILTFFLTFFMSAILDNLTAILLIVPITISTCRGLQISPKPLVLAEIFSTILAGISTLISSLPAIMIGSAAGLTFFDFIFINALFLLITVPLSLLYFVKIFENELIPTNEEELDLDFLIHLDEWSVVEDKQKFYLSLGVLILTILGFVLAEGFHVPIGWVAITGGVIALVVTKEDVDRILHQMHWDTIIFFIALFVLVGTLNTAGVLSTMANTVIELAQGNIFLIVIELLFGAAFLDAIVANIPLTAALIPVVQILVENQPPEYTNLLWFTLLFATTFGSAFTPIGSVTSVIGVNVLRAEDYEVPFVNFSKIMAPLSIILLIIGFFYLMLLQTVGFLAIF
ncbi:MAG: SLC13 family permease [Candidatus Hermodarchaeota archaeon]